MRLPFISTTSHASHPLLEKIIMLAPDRTCISKFFGPEYFLPVEVQLQQNGYDLFECMITGLPVHHQARGDYLEAHFRPLLDATLDMVMALQHVSTCTSGTELCAKLYCRAKSYWCTKSCNGYVLQYSQLRKKIC